MTDRDVVRLETRVRRLEGNFGRIVDRVESKVTNIRPVGPVASLVDALDSRMDNVESRLDAAESRLGVIEGLLGI